MILTHASGEQQRLVFRYETTGEDTTNTIAASTARTRARWEGTVGA
jgi:hypothetical protein